MRSIFCEPGLYMIRVAASLDAAWSDRLGGLAISEIRPKTEADSSVIELTGCLADQAALSGVLNTLYDYHFPLLHVEYLGPAGESVSET